MAFRRARSAYIGWCSSWLCALASARRRRPASRSHLLALPALMALLASAGCSLLLDSEQQQCRTHGDCSELFGSSAGYTCNDNFCSRLACKTDPDCLRGSSSNDSVCVNSYCEVDPKWTCLDAPTKRSNLPGPFAVTLQLLDTLSQTPLPAVTVRVCEMLDRDCAAPRSSQTTDPSGQVILQIPAAFSGYLSLTLAGYKEGLYFFNPPIERDTSDLTPVALATPEVHMGLAQRTGAALIEDRGILLIEAVDCQNRPTAGVSYDTADKDELAVPFYSSGGLPDTNATATDSFAFGGYINVLPGIVSVTGRLRDRERTLGTVPLLIKADAITYGRIAPSGR